MELIIIYIILIVLSKSIKRSTILASVIFLFAILVMGLNTENPDTSQYLYYYEGSGDGLIYRLEIGHFMIMRLCNIANLSFLQYKIIVSCCAFVLMYSALKKITINISYIAGFYLLCYLPQDVVQYRNLFAFTIILWGVATFLLNDKKNSRILYAAVVIAATSIHVSSIFFMLFLIPDKLINKITMIVMFLTSLIISASALTIFGTYIDVSLKNLEGYNNETKTQVAYFFIAVQILLCLYLLLIKKKFNISTNERLFSLIIKTNLLMLLIVPMYFYDMNFSRLFRFWCFPTFIALYGLLTDQRGLFFRIQLGLIQAYLVWLMMYRNIQIIYEPVFFNNLMVQ